MMMDRQDMNPGRWRSAVLIHHTTVATFQHMQYVSYIEDVFEINSLNCTIKQVVGCFCILQSYALYWD